MLTYQEFYNQYNGQTGVGDTVQNKGQCTGLIEVWLDNLSNPHIWGNAEDLYANAIPLLYEVVQNTPTNIPPQGAVVVLDGRFNNGVGHCGLATGVGDTNTFEMFEANDPLGSACHLQTYNYQYVTGWIIPKNIPAQNVSVDAETFTKLVHNSTVSDSVNDYLGTPLNSDFDPVIKNALDALKNKPPQVITVTTQAPNPVVMTVPQPATPSTATTSVLSASQDQENPQSSTQTETPINAKNTTNSFWRKLKSILNYKLF